MVIFFRCFKNSLIFVCLLGSSYFDLSGLRTWMTASFHRLEKFSYVFSAPFSLFSSGNLMMVNVTLLDVIP